MIKFKIARIKQNLTQEALANKSGVSRITISNLERNKIEIGNIRAGVLVKLSKALDTTVQELFFSEEE